LVEPENAHGEAFGDNELQRVLSENSGVMAAELSGELLSSLQSWQPGSAPQQDDITLALVDVV
jgi:serine phosphatase RsbU (regulator of sigma subunit)